MPNNFNETIDKIASDLTKLNQVAEAGLNNRVQLKIRECIAYNFDVIMHSLDRYNELDSQDKQRLAKEQGLIYFESQTDIYKQSKSSLNSLVLGIDLTTSDLDSLITILNTMKYVGNESKASLTTLTNQDYECYLRKNINEMILLDPGINPYDLGKKSLNTCLCNFRSD